MDVTTPEDIVTLPAERSVWDSVFTVSALVMVGTKEPDGAYDLAPKHMATAVGWEGFFAFVCTPRHATYHNVKRTGEFTVSYPRPTQVLLASLAAAPRCGDGSKAALAAIPTFAAAAVDGVLVADAYLFLECRLQRIVDGFGDSEMIVGKIVTAHARQHVIRERDRDDQDLVHDEPLLAYLAPSRFARIDQSSSFPFSAGSER